MQQQINLYHFMIKRNQRRIRYGLVLGGYAIFFILLMLYYSFEHFQKYHQVQTIKALEIEQNRQQNHLNQSTSSLQYVEESLNAISSQSTARNEVSILLNQKRFSDYLLEFAKAIPNGVSITHIQILKGGNSVNLMGRAVAAIQVQKFAEQLNHQSFFIGKKFEVINLTNAKDAKSGANYLDFQIKTRAG